MKEEKIYFESPKVKVTNVRMVFGHDTVAIDKIVMVDTNLRVISLYLSFLACLIAVASILILGYSAVLLVGMAFIWARWEYEHYIELFVLVEGRRYRIATSSITSRDCVYKIADALSLAIADNKRRMEMPGLTETETMQLRRLLLQVDKVDISGLEMSKMKKRNNDNDPSQ